LSPLIVLISNSDATGSSLLSSWVLYAAALQHIRGTQHHPQNRPIGWYMRYISQDIHHICLQ